MPTKKPTKTVKKPVSMPAKTVKNPVVITAKNQKTIASTPKEFRVDTSKLSKNKKFQELLDDAIAGIEIDTDDLDDEMLEAWEEFEDEIKPKLAKKNWALWATIFSPVILPGIVKGMRSEPTVPQPKVIIKGKQQNVIPPVIPKKVVDYTRKYFEERGLSLCKSLTETDLSRLKDDLRQNWDKGPDAFAEAFKESYPVSKSRLETIYKNERHQAEYSGVLERAKDADHSYKRWETIGDERTCDTCLSMDGEIVPINEKFSNGQMIPSAHVNCFAPDTKCIVPGKILGAARSWYEGRIIEINLESGARVSVTPNHMILTDRGFAAAYLLREGDNVLSCPEFERMSSSINSNNNNSVPTIEQIFNSLFMDSDSSTRSMPSNGADFHGDGKFIKGNIDIVDTNGFLLGNSKSSIHQPISKNNFGSGNIRKSTFFTFSSLAQIFESPFMPSNSIMGMFRKSEPFFLRRLRHSQKHSFATVSGIDSGFSEAVSNNLGTTPEMFSDGFDGHSRIEEGQNIINSDNKLFSSVRDIELYENFVDSSPATSKLIHDFIGRHSSLIAVNKIINVNIIDYHGYVYDVHSINSLLICNGVIASNCRCSMTTYSEEDYDDLPDEYIRQDASYLNEVAEQLKLNYKCEFNGTDYKCGNTIPSDDSKEIKIDNPFELNQKLSKYININEVQKAYDDAASELFEKYGSGPDSDWPPALIKEYEDDYDKISHLNKIHIDAVREFNYNSPQINNPTKDREKLLASQLKDTLDAVSTKQDLVMWRGERKSDWEKLAKAGSGLTDRFTPITQSKSIAEQFKGGSEPYLIRIEMPAGTHAIPSWNQGVESPNEKEWILNKDTKLEVIGKSGNILNVRVVNNKTKQDSAYLQDVSNFIKLNYKCPENSHGEGFGCGGEGESSQTKITIPKKFTDIDNIKSDKIRQDSSEFLNDILNNDEGSIKALEKYTKLGHIDVNRYLNGQDINTPLSDIKDSINKIDSIFKSQREQEFLTKVSITSYRGVSNTEITSLLGIDPNNINDINRVPINKIVTDPKYVSTSFNKDQALQFGKDRYNGQIITILLPKGSEALHTESISGSEDELLINRDQSYKFIGINKNIAISGLDSDKPVHEFVLELVPNTKHKSDASYLSDVAEVMKLNYGSYLSEVADFIKLNYNCPSEEKVGSGPGSCSGGKVDNSNDKESILTSWEDNQSKLYSTKEINFLNTWTDHYEDINRYLHGPPPDPATMDKSKLNNNQLKAYQYRFNDYQEKLSENKENVQIMDSIMEKSVLPDDIVTYRGIRDINRLPADILTVGKDVTLKGFTPTTIDKEWSLNFVSPVGAVLTIEVPKGTHATYMHKNKSSGEIEKELVLDRNLKYEVVDVQKTSGGKSFKDVDYKIKLRIVDSIKQNSILLDEVTSFIKLNYNCPDSEKVGSGPGSCSGGKVDNSDPEETYIGFKADHDFSSKQDREANMKVQAVLDRASEPLKKASREDIITLRKYSSTAFTSINQYLNGSLEKNYGKDNIIIKNVKKEVESMDRLFSEADLQDPLITYRGVKDNIMVKHPELRDALDTPGSEVQFPCFTSTSALPFQANRFADGYSGRLLELQLPKGTKALFIAEESGVPQEFEVLVNRGIKFEVGETKYTDVTTPEKGKKIVNRIKITTIKAIA